MNVLIIKNIATEGPGTIEEYLRVGRRSYSIVELGQGDAAPAMNDFSHVVIMGGPMAIYEMDQYPFLKEEANLIRQAIRENKPMLGVCLGAQMLAHVLGANVYAGGRKEIGWHEVELTPEGMADPVLSSLALDGASSARVFQWHGDTFDLPVGAVRLATSDLFPNQAFRYADRVYALQFHIEVTPDIVFGWLRNEKGIDLNTVQAESNRIYEAYWLRAMNFYQQFFSL